MNIHEESHTCLCYIHCNHDNFTSNRNLQRLLSIVFSSNGNRNILYCSFNCLIPGIQEILGQGKTIGVFYHLLYPFKLCLTDPWISIGHAKSPCVILCY